MGVRPVRLPSRFPVGTRYVIEGRGGRIQLRYLEFPDGRQVQLPVASKRAGTRAGANGRRNRQRRSRGASDDFSMKPGTGARVRRS
jgi:hypothetical protein